MGNKKTELKTINHQNNLALWSDQIEDCRSSGQTVSQWCAAHGLATLAYYISQRKVYEFTAKASGTFVEVQVGPQPVVSGSIATVSAGGLTAEIHSGADEATMAALFRAKKTC